MTKPHGLCCENSGFREKIPLKPGHSRFDLVSDLSLALKIHSRTLLVNPRRQTEFFLSLFGWIEIFSNKKVDFFSFFFFQLESEMLAL